MIRNYLLKSCDLFLGVLMICAIHPVNCLGEEAASQNGLIIGVLEYYYPKWANEPPNVISDKNPTYKRQVRILFKKSDAGWKAFKHDPKNTKELSDSIQFYPKRVNWFVAFDGKVVAQFKSDRPDDIKWYSDIGSHVPDPNANLPVVGTLSGEFSGWESKPSLRPLVLVSQDHVVDPDHWKLVGTPDPSIASRCVLQFRKIQPTVNVSTDEEYETMSPYDDKAILVNKMYASSKGEYLIALSIDPAFQHVDGIKLDEWPSDWFYLDKQKVVHALGSGMRLVDAGDYDNDGTSEVLFWEGGYNKGGYVIFYNRFSRSEEFSWSYH